MEATISFESSRDKHEINSINTVKQVDFSIPGDLCTILLQI
jgi:hypothetical protein